MLRARARTLVVGLSWVGVGAIAACVGDDPFAPSGPLPDGAAPIQNGTPDGSDGQDARASDAAGQDAGDASVVPTVYSALVPDKWSTFDVAGVNASAKGFLGAAFDGKYVYFVPENQGRVGRYDTQAPFSNEGAWTTFDLATVNPEASGYAGAVFDGRYLYLVPYSKNGAAHGLVARYDTQSPFGAAAAWTTFDTATVSGAASAFFSATFDGRYIYFVPGQNRSVVARYDTQAGFTSAAAWTTFNIATVNPLAVGFAGVAFDGRYIYLSPSRASNASGIVARYDTKATFETAGSWSTYDVSLVNANAKGFRGATFDGRYLYLVPSENISTTHGIVARYDTQATFDALGSWTAFDLTGVNASAKGFRGASFDGRYVYLVPFASSINVPSGVITRYDTTTGFSSGTSWSTFDISSTNPAAKGFQGAAFDGRHIYLAPSGATANSGVVARFEARTPAWVPSPTPSFF